MTTRVPHINVPLHTESCSRLAEYAGKDGSPCLGHPETVKSYTLASVGSFRVCFTISALVTGSVSTRVVWKRSTGSTVGLLSSEGSGKRDRPSAFPCCVVPLKTISYWCAPKKSAQRCSRCADMIGTLFEGLKIEISG